MSNQKKPRHTKIITKRSLKGTSQKRLPAHRGPNMNNPRLERKGFGKAINKLKQIHECEHSKETNSNNKQNKRRRGRRSKIKDREKLPKLNNTNNPVGKKEKPSSTTKRNDDKDQEETNLAK